MFIRVCDILMILLCLILLVVSLTPDWRNPYLSPERHELNAFIGALGVAAGVVSLLRGYMEEES